MKTLLIISYLFSINVFAETFIVEMQRPLTQEQIKISTTSGFKIELFDNAPTEYFKRTYRIETNNKKSIAQHFPIKTVEEVHRALHLSLETKKGSTFIRPDQLFHLQWGLLNQSQKIQKLVGNLKKVEVLGTPGSDIRWAEVIQKVEAGLKKEPIVAVVDMGIDPDHPDLKGRIFKNTIECDEKGQIRDTDEDKDGNGLKGDCMGWNFAGQSMYDAKRPYDDNGHGTHVSGIIAAETNKTGITGVSSRIRILPIRVTGKIDETGDRKNIQPLTDRIAKGILYATSMGADVINLSLGWTRSMDTKYLNEALTHAMNSGVVIVAAAGNNNNNANIFPCSHYDVICVGAATINGELANFSNYGGEVDVLAPGDEIVSTIPVQSIPLQLNVQGYDLRSGTSQAAPHVSAIAALLKGTFPRMHRDEVIRRIVDSADTGIPGKSLNGMVSLKGVFEIEAKPLVRPAFKRFSVALYDGLTNKFTFPLKIKNFTFEARDVVVTLKSLSPSFQMEQVFNFQLLRPNEVVTVKMEGDLLDPGAHNQIQFEVTISAGNMVTKSYRHEFRMARDILRHNHITTIPFEFENNPLPVGIINDGQVRNLINTVESLVPQKGLPEYYLPRVVKESGSMEIRFIRPQDGKMKEVPGTLFLLRSVQLLNVMRMDVNFDGEEDYLIRTIVCEKNCEDSTKAFKFIEYSFWKKDLSPLFAEKSSWRFFPTMMNVDIKTQRFYRLKTKDFGDIAVPMFLSTNLIPENQQKKSSTFSLIDKSILRRIYYLSPEVKENDEIHLTVQTISTTSYLEEVRSFAQAASSDEVHAMQLLSQGAEDLRTGKVRAVFSVGKGYLRKNIVVTLDEKPNTFSFYSISQNLWGYDHFVSKNLNDDSLKDGYSGLVSQSRLVMLQSELNKTSIFDAYESVETPLGTIASFHTEGLEYTFFQTPSYLVLGQHDKTSQEFKKLKINRFSFIPGTLFNDSFYPVKAKSNGQFVPALYVDETDIQNNLVSLTIFSEGILKSPLKMSAFIPPVCKAMDPVRLQVDEGHSLSLICLEDKRWVMKFIPFE